MSIAANLTIDLSALTANWRALDAVNPEAETAAVVKADSYGLGMLPIATALGGAGCRTFFVSHLTEAITLRAAMPDATIYVLHGITGATIVEFITHDLRPVLNNMNEVARWQQQAPASPAAVHVDTGMNRLGLAAAEWQKLMTDGIGFNLSLLIGHFIESEVAGSARTAQQLQAFAAAQAMASTIPASLANSSGVYVAGAAYQLTRPGIALYGGNPLPKENNPMQQVATLTAPILQVRHVKAGETAGYCGTFRATRPTVLATCAMGYADGWLRSGSNKAQAVVAGQRCPLVGNISMDLIIVDVTDVPAAKLETITHVELMGASLPVDEVAASMSTISYEVLTRLGTRITRNYING